MLKFLRIICIWICCAFCLLERIQLPVATAAFAAPFEYFDDHDQLSYDLDTEQSKAKYDTRLLSEQMLKSEKSTEHYESADSHSGGGGGGGGGVFGESAATNSELDDDTETEVDADVDDLQPHERAASCHNNGHKYTHGQKVPRIDPCEVCLCMDGEIFCWWELCAKKPTNQIKSDYPSGSQLDTSTARLNEMSSTSGTTVHPTVGAVQQQQQYQQWQPYATNLDVSSSKNDNNKNYQQHVKESAAEAASVGNTKSLQHTTKSWQKKKSYQQQQKQKHEQKQQHKHTHEHTHAAAAAADKTPYYTYHPSSPVSASKILSFPENLPSVLYHDYRTEEHQHHQHQHRQQHLKRQQRKLQLQMQQQQQKRKQQMQQHAHSSAWKSNTHQPTTLYQHDIFAANSVGANAYASSPALLYVGNDNSNMGFNADWGLVGGNENVYDDTEIDSDILPEPPTKKPKMTATTSAVMATMVATATATATAATTVTTTANETTDGMAVRNTDLGSAVGTSANVDIAAGVGAGIHSPEHVHLQQQQRQRQQSDSIFADNEKSLKMNAAHASASDSSTTPSPSAAVNVAISVSPTSSKIANKTAEHQQDDAFNRESSEEDQDDAFHRWLTSTETNNNNNKSNSTNSNSSDTNISSIEDSATQARRKNLFGPAGTQNINATIAAKSTNGTSTQREGNSSSRNNNNSKIGNVYFRSSYNDYSSEYNGSVVNIDILLTTADEQQQSQQQQQQQKEDLITQPSSNSQQATGTGVTSTTVAAASNISSLAVSTNTTTPPIDNVQTSSPERQCNVMGTLYKIGDVLPQDTGNCLQCVCIDGSTSDDTPRVTCSPHNCPPLVLPDLFDATGY